MRSTTVLTHFCLAGCIALAGLACSTRETPPSTEQDSAEEQTSGLTPPVKKQGGYSNLDTSPIVPPKKTMLSIFGNDQFSTSFKDFYKVDASPHFKPEAQEGARFDSTMEGESTIFAMQPTPAGGVYFALKNGVDLNAFQGGALKFEIKTDTNPGLVIRMKSANQDYVELELKYYAQMKNQWERINIPLAEFKGLDFSKIEVAFALAGGSTAVFVKNIFWLTDGDASQVFSGAN